MRVLVHALCRIETGKDLAPKWRMAMRAMWKGVLHLGKQSVPVKLYAAVEDTAVHFHLLHDGVRVEQRLVNPATGEPLSKDDIQKGFALEPGKFVILKPKELQSLEPEASRT